MLLLLYSKSTDYMSAVSIKWWQIYYPEFYFTFSVLVLPKVTMWSICGLCLCSSRKWSTKVSTISSSVSLTVVLFFMKVYLRNYLPPSHTAAIIQSDNKNIWQAVCVKLLSIMVSQPTGDSSVPVSISIPQVKLKCPVHVSSYITVWKHLFGNKSSPRIWLLRSLSFGRCKLICIFTLVSSELVSGWFEVWLLASCVYCRKKQEMY